MENDLDKATQEGNSSALQAATQFLTPGERLLWAEWANPTRSYIRRMPRMGLAFIPFILLCCYEMWQSNQQQLANHAEFLTHLRGTPPNIPPPMTLNPLMPVFFFGGFLLVSGAIIALIMRTVGNYTRTLYSITDRRIIVGYATKGMAPASTKSYGLETITEVTIKPNERGAGDIVFGRASGDAVNNMMLQDSGGIGVGPLLSYNYTRGENGLYGVRDLETPARLLRELKARYEALQANQEGASLTGPSGTARSALPDTPLMESLAPAAQDLMSLSLFRLFPAQITQFLRSEAEMRYNAAPSRGFASIPALLGVLVITMGLLNFSQSVASSLFFMLFGIPFLVFGVVGLLFVDTLTCDPATRTYRHRRGLGPLARLREGSWSDWERIAVFPPGQKFAYNLSMGIPTASTKRPYYVYLLWRDGKQGFPFCGTGANELALQIGQALGAGLDLPVKRESLPQAPKRTASQTTKANRIKAAGAVLVVLSWLNSRYNVVLWESRWKDSEGNTYVHQDTLWHGETHATASTGQVATSTTDFNLMGSSERRQTLPNGQPNEHLDLQVALRWGPWAIREEQQRLAGQAQRFGQYSDAESLHLQALLEPYRVALQQDPHNAHGRVSHTLLIAAQALEREGKRVDARYWYEHILSAGGAAAPADLAAAHLGLGRYYRNRMTLARPVFQKALASWARNEFQKTLEAPGCPQEMAEQARRELQTLPR